MTNESVQRLLMSGRLQTMLQIGRSGDRFEQEADRVAEAVLSPATTAQRKCAACAGEDELRTTAPTLQRCPGCDGTCQQKHSDVSLPTSAGHPLPSSTREFFETRFKRDFTSVRVHTDADAADAAHALHAKAFTIGTDVYFGARQYSPATVAGQRLLAHELTHTIQQGAIGARVQRSDQQHGPEEGAGSCIGYGTPALTGIAAHKLIGAQCGECQVGKSLPGGAASGRTGFVDLYRTWSPREARQMRFGPGMSALERFFPGEGWVAEIGEIKPDSWQSEFGTLTALDQVKRYINAFAQSYGPGNPLGLPPLSVIPMVTFRGIPDPGIPFGPSQLNQTLICRPWFSGIYFYSCRRGKKEEEKKKKQAQQQQQAQQTQTTASSVVAQLRARAPWLSQELAEEIAAKPRGLYRYENASVWAGGYRSAVVVYRDWDEIEVYNEYPSAPAFYENMRFVRSQSVFNRGKAAHLLMETYTNYNRDLWDLIKPREEGQLFRVSPDYARGELRGIYEQIFKLIVGGSAALLASGAAAGQVMSMTRRAAMQQMGVQRTVGTQVESEVQTGGQVIQFPTRTSAPDPAQVGELIGMLKAG